MRVRERLMKERRENECQREIDKREEGNES